jgi:BirA family transcriptional regulator, biotin operon repressor / biotin---[acetyl-CoA-carboxylase] ligase
MNLLHSFIELESVDSTNNYAMARAHAGLAIQGDLFFAHEQWAGKGQRGKSWVSNRGENIILSLVLEPVFLPITQQFSLSMAVALAAHDLFAKYAGSQDTTIKWPNDIYWRDRKAGGILIENSFSGDRWVFAIVGIGININQVQFPETAKNPVSLKQITGKSFDAVGLARELGGCLGDRYAQLRGEGPEEQLRGEGLHEQLRAKGAEEQLRGEGLHEQLRAKGPASLPEEYNARLYKLDQSVRFKKDNTVFETIVQGVSATGELRTRDGKNPDAPERRFRFGEVEWVMPL